MGYSREIYDAAMAELESRRTRAGAEAAARRETLLRRRPAKSSRKWPIRPCG